MLRESTDLIRGMYSSGNDEACHISLLSVACVCHELCVGKYLGLINKQTGPNW